MIFLSLVKRDKEREQDRKKPLLGYISDFHCIYFIIGIFEKEFLIYRWQTHTFWNVGYIDFQLGWKQIVKYSTCFHAFMCRLSSKHIPTNTIFIYIYWHVYYTCIDIYITYCTLYLCMGLLCILNVLYMITFLHRLPTCIYQAVALEAIPWLHFFFP